MFINKLFIKTSWVTRTIFPHYVWNMSRDEKVVYLSFDDGPHPDVTSFVLEELKKYNAQASFFCVGSNVALYPEMYQKILNEGHAVGNHTYNHPNGWKTSIENYVDDVALASNYIQSNLFRPPYGKIRKKQAGRLNEAMNISNARVVMWDVLSADFDTDFSPQQCLDNVVKNCINGSIVVFHDSEKAFPNLRYCLPEVLKFLGGEGYSFRKIEL